MYLVKRWRGILQYLLLLSVLGMVSAGDTGCIWLALPGLAYGGYQGYKYERQLNSQPAGVSDPSQSSPDSRSTPSSDHSIE